jgi:hypothetical protein
MQHGQMEKWHGQAAWMCSTNKQQGHKDGEMDMQHELGHGHAAWTISLDMDL